MPAYGIEYRLAGERWGQLEIDAATFEEAERIASHLRTIDGSPVRVLGEVTEVIPFSVAGDLPTVRERQAAVQAEVDRIVRGEGGK